MLQHGYQETWSSIDNVNDIFNICNFSYQQKLIRKIFQTGLSFDGTIFRTSYIHPAFVSLLDEVAEKKLLAFEQSKEPSDIFCNQMIYDNEKKNLFERDLASSIVELMGDNFIKN